MSENVELLSKSEYESVGEMLLNLIAICPFIPEGLTPQYQSIETDESIGIFTLPGSKYLKKNVMGGFTARVNFRVAYKSFPTGNGERIKSQSVVDKIMGWLEKVNELPKLSGERTITKITASDSVPYTDDTGSDKSTIFAADAVMEYEAE